MNATPVAAPRRQVTATIDGQTVRVSEGATILDACRSKGIDTPTLCYLENLTPVNVCRVCVVEVEGSRTLVPACSRPLEADMVVNTDTERVRHSRKLVFELLGSSTDLSLVSEDTKAWMDTYGARPDRFGATAEKVDEPFRQQDDLYVRDYDKCILCYRCVEACGTDAQNTFAIAVSGRGFEARISTEWDAVLPDSACVYCGNCVGVCPTGALMFTSEYERREAGTWNPAEQTITETICSYCGVGCAVNLHVQEGEIVKVTSPLDNDITNGHLCVKGRFGWTFVHNK